MKYNFLGNTGLVVSELCFGTMTFGGNGYWEAIGKVQQKEVNDLMKTVVGAGINFIDTANVYSFGESERLLGQSIKEVGINRNDLVKRPGDRYQSPRTYGRREKLCGPFTVSYISVS